MFHYVYNGSYVCLCFELRHDVIFIEFTPSGLWSFRPHFVDRIMLLSSASLLSRVWKMTQMAPLFCIFLDLICRINLKVRTTFALRILKWDSLAAVLGRWSWTTVDWSQGMCCSVPIPKYMKHLRLSKANPKSSNFLQTPQPPPWTDSNYELMKHCQGEDVSTNQPLPHRQCLDRSSLVQAPTTWCTSVPIIPQTPTHSTPKR